MTQRQAALIIGLIGCLAIAQAPASLAAPPPGQGSPPVNAQNQDKPSLDLTQVPEPAAVLLVVVGVLGLGIVRSQRR